MVGADLAGEATGALEGDAIADEILAPLGSAVEVKPITLKARKID
jgi:hypothetical protein